MHLQYQPRQKFQNKILPDQVCTGFSSEIGTKLRDWAVGQAGGSCYSQAALSSNDSKTLYALQQQSRQSPKPRSPTPNGKHCDGKLGIYGTVSLNLPLNNRVSPGSSVTAAGCRPLPLAPRCIGDEKQTDGGGGEIDWKWGLAVSSVCALEREEGGGRSKEEEH